jgi:glycerol-3-phosphate dehydrogenase
MYDAPGLFRNIQRHRWLTPSEVQERERLISQQGLLGAARFYDAQADAARLTLTIAKSAHVHDALAANHVRVADLMTAASRGSAACLVDELHNGEIEALAKVIVNPSSHTWGCIRRDKLLRQLPIAVTNPQTGAESSSGPDVPTSAEVS